MSAAGDGTKQGIGARVQRKEDARFLHGRGQYVTDMVLPGQREVAFLRSPIAHGRVVRIVKPAGKEAQVEAYPFLLVYVDPDGRRVEEYYIIRQDTPGATPHAVLQSPESVNALRQVFGYRNRIP